MLALRTLCSDTLKRRALSNDGNLARRDYTPAPNQSCWRWCGPGIWNNQGIIASHKFCRGCEQTRAFGHPVTRPKCKTLLNYMAHNMTTIQQKSTHRGLADWYKSNHACQPWVSGHCPFVCHESIVAAQMFGC